MPQMEAMRLYVRTLDEEQVGNMDIRLVTAADSGALLAPAAGCSSMQANQASQSGSKLAGSTAAAWRSA